MNRRMRIGFDAKRLFHNQTGLGNYSRTLVRNLKLYFPEIEIVLFTPEVGNNVFAEEFRDESKYEIVEVKKYTLNAYWRSFGISRDIASKKLNIYHGLSNEIPFKKVNGVSYIATIHDLIFKEYPSQYKRIDRLIYNCKTQNIVHLADHILSISEATKKDIIQHYNIESIDVSVVYQSCKMSSHSANNDNTDLLFVSSITERKNLLTVLKAINELKRKLSFNLNVVGSGNKYEQICKDYVRQNKLESHVTFLGAVSDSELSKLYSTSLILIYPSMKEGFGIPIIEALNANMQVITVRQSSMIEAGGNAAHYLDSPGDWQRLSMMIEQLLNPDNQVIDFDRSHLQTFLPEKVTRDLVDLYQKVLSK